MNDDQFKIGLALYKEGQSKKASDLRKHLHDFLQASGSFLEKFKSQSDHSEIESFMRAALEDNSEHEVHKIAARHSILPNDVIKEFLANDEDE